MEGIREFIEPKDVPPGAILEYRTEQLQEMNGFGSPDLCFLFRQSGRTGMAKMFKKNESRASFHYVYGADTSSQATVVAYFQSFMNDKKAKLKLIRGIFWIFDIFSKKDIRVEVKIPGTFSTYVVDETTNRSNINDIYWKGAYLSSMMRYFKAKPCPGTRMLIEQQTPANYGYFFECASSMIQQVGFVLGDTANTVKYSENLLYSCISEYLLNNRRISFHRRFFEALAEADPLMLTYVSQSYATIKNNTQAVRVLASQLQATPHSVPLLLKQAEAFLNLGRTEEAIEIANYCIQLNPDSFDAWILLSELYLNDNKYSLALISLNLCPIYENQAEETGIPDFSEWSSVVEGTISVESEESILFQDDIYSFRPNTQHVYTAKERMSVEKLDELPSNDYNKCEQQCYSIIVRIEKEIGWEKLLKIRTGIFLMEQDTNGLAYDDWEEDEVAFGSEDESMIIISKKADSLDRKHRPVAKKIDTLNEELPEGERRDEGDEPTVFNLKKPEATVDPDIARQKRALGTPEQTQRTQREYLLASPSLANQPRVSRVKRLCTKFLDGLFSTLYSDLNALFEWQAEDTENLKPSAEIPYTGKLWIRRGMLAERLCRNRLAERAFRICIDKGFSLYAWHRLMAIYCDAGNPRATLVCIAEIIDQLQEDKISTNTVLPRWILEVLAQTCHRVGMQTIKQLVQELGLQEYVCILKSIQCLEVWETEGYLN